MSGGHFLVYGNTTLAKVIFPNATKIEAQGGHTQDKQTTRVKHSLPPSAGAQKSTLCPQIVLLKTIAYLFWVFFFVQNYPLVLEPRS